MTYISEKNKKKIKNVPKHALLLGLKRNKTSKFQTRSRGYGRLVENYLINK